MILKVLLRILFVVFSAWFAVTALQVGGGADANDFNVTLLYTAVATVFSLGVVFYEWRFQRGVVRELVAIVFGMATGLAVSALLILMMIAFFMPSASQAESDIGTALTAAFWMVKPWIPLVLLACCYIAITVVIETKDDFRFLVPYIDFSQRGTQEGGLVLDTSAIIDGRFADMINTHVISVPVVIPDFVIRELQTIADSSDKMKRLRGRRGLDIVSQLQKTEAARVVIRESAVPATGPVDDELVRLTKEINGRIVTTDFNLNKVSQIEGLHVININDIANTMRPSVLPGDTLKLKIIRPGQESGQGVGYLEDGTMVVVEHARESIGEEIETEITGSIQTSAGRMIFAKPREIEAGERA